MDKRWIYILIIFIVGIATLAFIVDTSTTVGSAIVSISTYTDTVPDGYNIEDSEKDHAVFINRKTNEKIYVGELGKGNLTDKKFDEKVIELSNNENVTNINFTGEVYNNITLKTICYEKLPDNTINKASFFMKFNHTFIVNSYNYHDENKIDEGAHFVIDTLQKDYKKSQD